MLRTFLLVCSALFMLSACDRTNGGSLAQSTAPEELMRVAVPGWAANGKQAVRQIATSDNSGTERSFFSLAPALVVKQAEDKITLIVVGSPTNADGGPQAGHTSRAVLGAYWFEKQKAHWQKVAEQANFGEEGFFGNPGDLRQLDLGNGTLALAVENGSCWQGSCMKWLSLYALGDKTTTKIFSDGISSDSENATASCSDLLKLGAGKTMRVPLDDYSTYTICRQITGTSKVLPSKSGPGQLVIEYNGVTTAAEAVPLSAESKARYINDGNTEDELEKEYLVTITPIRQKQTYSFRNGKYVLVKGKNPNPGI